MNEEEMIGIVGKLADAETRWERGGALQQALPPVREETYRRRSSPSFRKLLISMCFYTFSA